MKKVVIEVVNVLQYVNILLQFGHWISFLSLPKNIVQEYRDMARYAYRDSLVSLEKTMLLAWLTHYDIKSDFKNIFVQIGWVLGYLVKVNPLTSWQK